MEPALPTGSVVVIRAQPSYSAGDVVTFGRAGTKELVTHRISAVNYGEGSKTFVTKGDANNSLDQGSITNDQIQGKVVFDIPYLGYVQNWLRTPTGFAVAVVLPAAILIYGELMTIKNELLSYLRKRKNVAIGLVVVGSLGLVGGSTNAYLSDLESVSGNKIGVAINYSSAPITPVPLIEENMVVNEITNEEKDVTVDVDEVEIISPVSSESGDLNLTDTTGDETNPEASKSVNLEDVN